MTDQFLQHVAGRIRFYRKAGKLTIDDLARAINKSKSSVSKYEAGKVVIDIVTLYEICAALRVDPKQLLDFTPMSEYVPNAQPFGFTDTLYLYHRKGTSTYCSAINLVQGADGGTQNAILFLKLSDIKDFNRCECLYHGNMYCHDTILCFTFRNSYNPAENILLNFLLPIRKFTYISGLICGLDADTLTPTCYKAVISKAPLACDDKLDMLLTVSKEDHKRIRAENRFSSGSNDLRYGL